MPRVAEWKPEVLDDLVNQVLPDRLLRAARVVWGAARARCPVGTLSRPMYRRGRYAGQAWTARDGGQLKKSVRVVQRKGKSGRLLAESRNVRVYAGHYLAYYASIVEYSRPFMRPALEGSRAAIKQILGAR